MMYSLYYGVVFSDLDEVINQYEKKKQKEHKLAERKARNEELQKKSRLKQKEFENLFADNDLFSDDNNDNNSESIQDGSDLECSDEFEVDMTRYVIYGCIVGHIWVN